MSGKRNKKEVEKNERERRERDKKDGSRKGEKKRERKGKIYGRKAVCKGRRNGKEGRIERSSSKNKAINRGGRVKKRSTAKGTRAVGTKE